MLAQRILRPLRALDSAKRLMCSAAAIQKLTVTIPTKTPERVHYEMPYIRTNRGGTTRILAIHGTPGSLEDFRCLIGPLQRRIPNSEFIAMTLPDLNFTFRTETFWHSADEKQHLILQFLDSLQINEIDIMIGHSAGMYPTLLTALYSPITVKSVVTICGTGTEILPSLKPEWLHTKFVLPMLRNRSTRTAGLALFGALMKLSGFSKMSAFDACSSLQTQYATRFWDEKNSPRWLCDLNEKDIPRLLLYGAKDKLIHAKASAELARHWGSPSVKSHYIYGGSDDASVELQQEGETGSRCPVVVFKDGGHFAFMQFPEITAEHIARLREIVPRSELSTVPKETST